MIEVGRALGGDTAANFPARGGFYRFLRDEWEQMLTEAGPPAESDAQDAQTSDFEADWADALRRGGATFPVEPVTIALSSAFFETDLVSELTPVDQRRSHTLITYPSLHFFDGRGANRPWLQEIPEPMLKTTWGSGLEMTADTADAVGAVEGQVVTVTSDHGQVDASVIITGRPHALPGPPG